MSGGFDGLNIFGSILSRTNKRVGFGLVDTNGDKKIDRTEFSNVESMFRVNGNNMDFDSLNINRSGESAEILDEAEWARIQTGMDLQKILNGLKGKIASVYTGIDAICQQFVVEKLADAARSFNLDQENVQEVFAEYMNQQFNQIYEGLSSAGGLDGCRRPGAARDEANTEFLESLNIYEEGQRPEGTEPSFSKTCEKLIKNAVQQEVKNWINSHLDEWNTMDINALNQAKANLKAHLAEFMTPEKIQELENQAKAEDIAYCQYTVAAYNSLKTTFDANVENQKAEIDAMIAEVDGLLEQLSGLGLRENSAITQIRLSLTDIKQALETAKDALNQLMSDINALNADITALNTQLSNPNITSLQAEALRNTAEASRAQVEYLHSEYNRVLSYMVTLGTVIQNKRAEINNIRNGFGPLNPTPTPNPVTDEEKLENALSEYTGTIHEEDCAANLNMAKTAALEALQNLLNDMKLSMRSVGLGYDIIDEAVENTKNDYNANIAFGSYGGVSITKRCVGHEGGSSGHAPEFEYDYTIHQDTVANKLKGEYLSLVAEE